MLKFSTHSEQVSQAGLKGRNFCLNNLDGTALSARPDGLGCGNTFCLSASVGPAVWTCRWWPACPTPSPGRSVRPAQPGWSLGRRSAVPTPSPWRSAHLVQLGWSSGMSSAVPKPSPSRSSHAVQLGWSLVGVQQFPHHHQGGLRILFSKAGLQVWVQQLSHIT